MRNYAITIALLLFLFVGVVDAQVVGVTTLVSGISSGASTTLALSTGNIVAAVIINSSAASAIVEVYDTAVTTTRAAALADAGLPTIAIKCAVDEDSRVYVPVVPDLFSTGIFIYVANGQALIKRLSGI